MTEPFCVWVCPAVSEWVRSMNLVNMISQKLMKGISSSYGHSCFHGCADWILGSKGQRSSSQQAMTRKPCEHHISTTNETNFTQFWPQMYLGWRKCWVEHSLMNTAMINTAETRKHHSLFTLLMINTAATWKHHSSVYSADDKHCSNVKTPQFSSLCWR